MSSSQTSSEKFSGRHILTEEEAWRIYFKVRQKRLDKAKKA